MWLWRSNHGPHGGGMAGCAVGSLKRPRAICSDSYPRSDTLDTIVLLRSFVSVGAGDVAWWTRSGCVALGDLALVEYRNVEQLGHDAKLHRGELPKHQSCPSPPELPFFVGTLFYLEAIATGRILYNEPALGRKKERMLQ